VLLAPVTPVRLPGDGLLVSMSRDILSTVPCLVRIAQLSLRSRGLHQTLLTLSGAWLLALSWLFARVAFVR
jgi:hypothetical protein